MRPITNSKNESGELPFATKYAEVEDIHTAVCRIAALVYAVVLVIVWRLKTPMGNKEVDVPRQFAFSRESAQTSA